MVTGVQTLLFRSTPRWLGGVSCFFGVGRKHFDFDVGEQDGTSVSTLTAAGPFVGALTVDAAGTLYYAEYNTGGLYMLPAGAAAPTVVIPPGNAVVLGSAPTSSSSTRSRCSGRSNSC